MFRNSSVDPYSGSVGKNKKIISMAALFFIVAATAFICLWGGAVSDDSDAAVGDIIVSDGVKYKVLSDTEAEVVENDPIYSGVIVIKSTVTDDTGNVYSVTSIGIGAFSGCSSLTSVTIPNSVTSIGDRAFRYCSLLTSVTIGSSVESVGSSAFNGCTSLESVIIPNSVKTIGNNAFSGCSSLTSVTIPDRVTSISNGVFNGCTSLESVIIPNSVTSISNSAFQGCTSLESVIIPSSITSIGNSAFYNCTSLASVTIGSGVTSIGNSAFKKCGSLSSIVITRDVPPSLGTDAFSGVSSEFKVLVNPGKCDVYKAYDNWKVFDIYAYQYAKYNLYNPGYNGTEQTGVEIESGCVLYGDVSATNVGNYVAYAALLPEYAWEGDTVDPKQVEWSIVKGTPVAGDFQFNGPADSAYSGTAKTATVTVKTGVVGMGDITAVKYYSDSDCTSEVQPINAGKYYVAIDVAEGANYSAKTKIADSSWMFTITKVSPAYGDFQYTAPVDPVYDGELKEATVVAKDGVVGMGDITVKYYSDSGLTTEKSPVDAGTYYVAIDVAEGANYSAKTKIADSSWRFDIAKAENSISVKKTSYCIESQFSVGASAKYGEPALTYLIKTGDDVASVDADGNITTGLKVGKATLSITAEELDNYKEVTVDFEIDIHAHTPEKVPGKVPTETDAGLTEGSKCSECQKILVEQRVLDPTGSKQSVITVDESKADYEVPETEKISTIVFVVNDSSDTDRAIVEFSEDATGNVKGKVVRISIERVSEEQEKYEALFTVNGAEIAGDMLITLHFDPSKGTPSVRWVEGNVLMETIEVDNEKGTVTFATTHNSTYQIEYAEPISINWSIVLVLVLIVALAAYLLVSKR